MITRTEINNAIAEATDIARKREKAVIKSIKSNERINWEEYESLNPEVTVGNITVKASIGGNTVRQHVRISFKIDGKRASRAKVDELITE